MNNKDVEKLIRDEFNKGTPNDFDAISKRCKELGLMQDENKVVKIDNVKPKVEKRRNWKLLSIAALFILIIGLGTFWNQLQKMPAYRVQIDVNPSVEIVLNRMDKVIEYKAINADAEQIVNNVDITNKSLEEVIQATVQELVNEGYLNQDNKSILISVIGKDQDKAEKVENKALNAVQQVSQDDSLDLDVYDQCLDIDEEISDIAAKYGISEGKAALVSEINKTTQEDEAEALSQLSVTELTNTASSLNKENVTESVATPSDIQSANKNDKEVKQEEPLPSKEVSTADKTQKTKTDDQTDETEHQDNADTEETEPEIELFVGENEKVEDAIDVSIDSEPFTMEAAFNSEDNTDDEFIWTIESGEDIIEISTEDNKCEIKGLKTGEATLTVVKGDKKTTVKINVK